MNHNLMQPQTRAALRALAARRRRVLMARGLFAFVLTLLAAMAAVAMLDRLLVMGQTARLVLSLSAYVGVVAVVWLTSLRFLVRWPSDAELARLIERAEPQLREDLVSAVELSDDGQGMDSAAFREVLQRNVGKRVAGIDPQRVLPWKMIAWWATVSTGAVIITVVLLLTPGLRYGEMLTRAMLPTADRDRVSSTIITLLDPSPDSDGRVPMNERVPIRVRVAGGTFDKVELEVDRGESGKETVRFAATREQGEYAIDLPVTDQPLRFRVAAGDGLTRYYELDPTARPRITRAAQTTTPPRYTGFEPKQSTGDLGPITALAGSVVDLVLTADQPIKQAELRLELAGEESAIPLSVDPADPTRLRGSVAIDRSGDYRVYLVAADSGFDTPDAQRHELTALPDELPSVTLDQPTGAGGSARDALIRVAGSASDDVALASVRRETRVNGGNWVAAELEAGRRGAVTEALDLLDLKLNVGDEVELRLAATDRADNTSYSDSARLIVTPDGLRRLDAQALGAQNALLTALDQSAAAARVYAQSLDSYRDAQGNNTPATTRQQRLTRVRSALLALQDTHGIAESRVVEAIDLAVPGREADHFVRIGRLIANPQTNTDATGLAQADRDQLKRTLDAVNRDAQAYEQAGDLLRGMLTLATAEAVDLQITALQQAIHRARTDLTLDDAVDATLADQRLYRRIIGILAQTRQAEQGLVSVGRLSKGSDLERLVEQTQAPLAKSLDDIEAKLTAQSSRDQLLDHLNSLERELAQTGHRAFSVMVQSERAARELYNRDRDELPLDQVELDALAKQPADDALWSTAQNTLARHADLEELSPDSDRPFVQDLSQAMAALDEHRRSAELGQAENETRDLLVALANAHGTLERIHDLRTLRAMVKALGDSEAQRDEDAFASFRHRGDWEAIDERLDDVVRRMREVDELKDATRSVGSISRSPEYRAVNQEIDQRRLKDHKDVSREEELYDIVAMIDRALAEARPAVKQARQTIAEQTPTLPERMRNLAERTEDLSEQSRQAAERAEQEPSAQAQRDAAQLAEQQEQVNRRLERVSEEIRRQADQEDLLTEEGRERSRDADDAIAMLKPDAEQATQQLSEAQTLERADLQAQAIEHAAEAQQRSAETLRELAEHFENLEQNDPAADQTRQALREAEDELGIREQLDEQYERMERLAELAEADDADRLAELEEMLQQDPAMQRELDRLAEEMAQDARDQVADAAAQEQQLANQLADKDDQAEQQRERQQQALQRLAERANELERDQVRNLADEAAREVPEARDEVQEARESLRDAADQARPNAQAQQEQGEASEQQQRIERFAEETREASDNVNEATQQAEQRRNEQREQAQQARQAADRGVREGEPNAEAARQVVEASRAAENAEQVRRSAERTAREAEQLANQAEQLANQARAEGEERSQDLGQAAQQQEQLADQTQQSAEDLARAARHQERLGDQQRAEQLQQQAEQVEQLAEQTLPQAEQQTANADRHEQGEQAAREAGEQLQQQAQRMAGEPQAGQPQEGQPQQGQPQQGEQGEPQSGQPQNGEPQQGEPQQGEPQSGQPQQGQPQQGKPQSGQPQSGEPQQGDPQSGQPQQGQPQQGEPQSGQPQSGQPQSGQPQSGQPQSGQPQSGQPQSGQPGSESAPMDQQLAEQLARELDRLDQQLAQQVQDSPQPGEGTPLPGEQAGEQPGQQPGQQPGEQPGQGQQPGQPGQPGEPGQTTEGQSPSAQPGNRPIDQAAQQQAQNIRQQRNPNAPGSPAQPGQPQPGQSPMPGMAQSDSPPNGPGAPENNGAGPAPAGEQGELGDAPEGEGNWGDLPERMVEDLNQGARERAPADYLDQVDAYFRAIAERAQQDAQGQGGDE